jgi:WD40 repeat protein
MGWREVRTLYGAGGSVAFSSDGRLLASAAGKSIKIWSVRSGKLKMTLHNEKGRVNAVAFSPASSSLLASGNYANDGSGWVSLWNVSSGRLIATLPSARGGFVAMATPTIGGDHAVSFSRNGKLVAGGNEDGAARVWNVQKRKRIGLYDGGDYPVKSVAFSPNSKILANGSGSLSGSGIGWIQLTEIASGKAIGTLTCPNVVETLAFSPSGKYLACGSGRYIQLWHVKNQEVSKSFPGHRNWLEVGTYTLSIAFNAAGSLLATMESDNVARIWEIDSESCVFSQGQAKRLSLTASPGAVAFSPVENLLAIAREDTILYRGTGR